VTELSTSPIPNALCFGPAKAEAFAYEALRLSRAS